MKVLFINPRWAAGSSVKGQRHNRAWPPLCLINCASVLINEGIDAKIIDANALGIGPKNIAAYSKKFDKVFITSSTIDRWQCPSIDITPFMKFVEELQKENLYIMGAHGTAKPKEILEITKAEAVICGEPEETVLKICKGMPVEKIPGLAYIKKGKIVLNKDAGPVDINMLPVPKYELVNLDRYYYEVLGKRLVILYGSRGCPYSCTFCFKQMNKSYRKKNSEKLIDEVRYAVEKCNAKSAYFFDLEFTINKELVNKLCEFLINKKYDFKWCCQTRADSVDFELLKKMRTAGCRLIHFGVETGSPRIMKIIDKRNSLEKIEKGVNLAKKAGIGAACFFLFGFPTETKHEMMQTIRFAKKLNPDYASFHIVTPYPGTKIHRELDNSSRLFPRTLYEESYNELLKIKKKAFLSFYIRPRYIISRLSSPGNLSMQLKLFLSYLK